jgi:hypothetical protein
MPHNIRPRLELVARATVFDPPRAANVRPGAPAGGHTNPCKACYLDLNGVKDEAIPPKVVDAHRMVLEPYVGNYRVARVSGFQHYLYKQDSIKVVGNLIRTRRTRQSLG